MVSPGGYAGFQPGGPMYVRLGQKTLPVATRLPRYSHMSRQLSDCRMSYEPPDMLSTAPTPLVAAVGAQDPQSHRVAVGSLVSSAMHAGRVRRSFGEVQLVPVPVSTWAAAATTPVL